jgi:murein DD-endopeptidase MepM/ murein hydrolase activator NlpD
MAFKTTRDQRAQRWRIVPSLIVATFAFSACQIVCASGSMAQIKAPNKNHLKAPTKSTSTAPSEDVQPFAIGTDGSVADQLTALKIDPVDAQAAANAVGKALEQLDRKTTNSGRAVMESQGADKPKRLVALQLYSAKSLAVELHRGADGSYGFKVAPNATENDDERVSSLPSTTTTHGAGARSVVAGSVSLVKVNASSGLATSLASTGASTATLKELTEALAGFRTNAKVEVWKGRTVDGAPRLLAASISEGTNKQSFWWFAPPNQPEGWFDEQGRRLGGTALAEPSGGSRISSPFGTRRYYGRSSGGGFHNGIDFEGKTGMPIYAAADGVLNHQGWLRRRHGPGQPRQEGRPDRLCRLDRPLDRPASALLGDRERPVRRSRALHLREGRQQRPRQREPGRLSPVAAGDPQGRRRQGRQQQPLPRPAGRGAVEPQPLLLAQRGSPVIWRPPNRLG